MNYIKKEDLIKGKQYECDARNFTVGTWNGKEFVYLRTKFGQQFDDTELHWDDGEPHGTVKPLKIVN